MSNINFEPSPEHIAYALLGCFIIFFGLVSLFVKEKLFISEAFVATAFGIIMGPYAIGIFNPVSWDQYDTVTLEFTRIVIAVQVMAAGILHGQRETIFIHDDSASHDHDVAHVGIVDMGHDPGPGLCKELLEKPKKATQVLELSFLTKPVEAMVLAACVTPTDPVLSNSVVKGRFAEKHVPPRLRYLLSAESGINDGMGLPFLFLGLYLMREKSVGTAFGKWFYMVWAYQILLSIVLGGLIGAAARKLVKGAKNRNLIDKESFLVFSIALTLAVVGCVAILASDDLLACFIAGNVFAWDDWFSNEIAEAHIQETIDMLLNLACFVYIGSSIPFSSFHDATLQLSIWRLVVLAVLILLLRRLPFVIMLKRTIPALATYREAAFAGWFGPIGVGAVYFSKVTAKMTDPNNLGDNPHNVERLLRVRTVIFPVVMFLVLSSVFIHGITVPLLHLQYKYTRTWSRKREESSHVVTRLPHINIGDEIVLRPPTINGSNGYMEGDGDHQRSVGYDNQRSLNQRSSLGFGGNPLGNGGFAIAGVADLSRTSIHSNNNGRNGTGTRTLEDVVQEMKEAARSKGIRHPNHAAATSGNHHNGGGGAGGFLPLSFDSSTEPSFAESTIVQLGDAISMDGSHRSTSPLYRGRGVGPNSNNNNEHAQEYIESLRDSHPASQGLNVRPSDVQSNSASGSSGSSSTTVLAPLPSTSSDTNSLQNGQGRALASEFHEIEREEDNGVVREESHEIDERGREQIERVLEDEYRQQQQQQHSDTEHIHPHGSTGSRPSFESGTSIAGYGSGSGSQEASLRPVASEDPEWGGGDDGGVAVDQQRSSSSGSSSSRLHRQLVDIFKSLKRDRDSKSIG
ncbi:hypothetical protein KVV02_006674 [Mortierella alpina]|uniref:Cation/H+ exchanger transmembrane domain-containing protein n=1 Tax=Mortierella alpina TaxID=64518 RepID=A0A9P8CXA8_MORAP|nr:hypothetical protein KVV02_006674 [Mortierella alpina]